MTEYEALAEAVKIGAQSPCAKSKRGVVIFVNEPLSEYVLGAGFNHPPKPFKCAATNECRRECGKICIHAEQAAILNTDAQVLNESDGFRGCDMLHVKVVDGKPVPSGGPSCVECSKLILEAGLAAMWLYEDRGGFGDGPKLYRYTAVEFHEQTLRHLELPTFRGE